LPARVSLRDAVAALRKVYGAPPPPLSDDPFQLILWEQIGYLASDETRATAFEALRKQVGLAPAKVFGAPAAKLAAVSRLGGGVAVEERADRMRASAEQVLARWGGDLRAVLALPVDQARKALAKFPMIGEPGADKILSLTGAASIVALDSNALRVLQRLGLADEAKDYRTSYRSAQVAVSKQLPTTRDGRIAAGYLLRRHGQEVCRRTAPECPRCPLAPRCEYVQSSARRRK
jgi:endonuclease III